MVSQVLFLGSRIFWIGEVCFFAARLRAGGRWILWVGCGGELLMDVVGGGCGVRIMSLETRVVRCDNAFFGVQAVLAFFGGEEVFAVLGDS
ncbi:MAG: hypothetical protein FWD57_05500 [Polyangiaceae bacterium]|nr:hypothetical protein [Polyangiaceae bacterium]